jgi:hypothetical protein
MWRRRPAHLMVDRKGGERERERERTRYNLQRHAPVTFSLHLGPTFSPDFQNLPK